MALTIGQYCIVAYTERELAGLNAMNYARVRRQRETGEREWIAKSCNYVAAHNLFGLLLHL